MIIGALRVKDENRWIERAIRSILPLCDRVVVFDDNSTDNTVELCRLTPKTEVIRSPFNGLDEQRDKNRLLDEVMGYRPEWIIMIDGDEMLAPGAAEQLRAAMRPGINCISLRVLYLWNDENTVRMDGVYGDFHRESVFRPTGARFEANGNGGNFHCGNVPWAIRQKRTVTDIPLYHFGYLHREDRLRKYAFYNEKDPDNLREDKYRHVCQGDLPEIPADIRLMHAGPLKLEPLNV